MSLVFGEVDTPNVKDGSLRGVTGPLVKVPVPNYTSAVNGAGTVSENGTADNPDGLGKQVNLLAPPALGNNAVIRCELFGRVIGIRHFRRSSVTIYPFDVVIDGVAYPVEDVTPRRDNQSSTATDNEALAILATGLADTRHTVEVHVNPDPALAQNNSLFLYGFIVERGRGYNDTAPQPRGGFLGTPATLSTGAGAITASTTQTFSGLTFQNTDATSRLVTVIGSDGSTIYKTLVLTAAGTSGASATIQFPSPRKLMNGLVTWKWKADAASVVLAWAENA